MRPRLDDTMRWARAAAMVVAGCVMLGTSAASSRVAAEPPHPGAKPDPSASSTQPPTQDRPPEDGAGERVRPIDREVMRKRLDDRIEQLEQQLRRLREFRILIDEPDEGVARLLDARDELRALMQDPQPRHQHSPTAAAPPLPTPPGAGHAMFDADGKPTASTLEVVREFMAATNPTLLAKFDELAQSQPQEASGKLAEMAVRLREMVELRRVDPELYRLRLAEINTRRLLTDAARDVLAMEQSENKDEAALREARSRMESLGAEAIEDQIRARTVERERFAQRRDRMANQLEQIDRELADLDANRSVHAARTIENVMNRLKQRSRGGPERRMLPEPIRRPFSDGPPDRHDGEKRPKRDGPG